MTVEANMDEVRKPSLQPQVQQAKARMLDIKVNMQTAAGHQLQLQHFSLVITFGPVGAARLYATQNRYQALPDVVATDNVLDLLLFRDGRAVEVQIRAARRLGQLLSVLTHLGRQAGGEVLEILKQHLGFAQILLKDIPTIQIAQRALQSDPIKTVKNSP